MVQGPVWALTMKLRKQTITNFGRYRPNSALHIKTHLLSAIILLRIEEMSKRQNYVMSLAQGGIGGKGSQID